MLWSEKSEAMCTKLFIYLYTNFNQKIKCNLINEYVLSVCAFSSVYDHH